MAKGDKPVFSTSAGQMLEAKRGKSAKDGARSYQRATGPCKLRLETKGRGGKAVTVLFNLAMSEEEATAMMKDMQAKFGCGATLKDSAIELRGDMREKVEVHLTKLGIKSVRAGG